MPEVQSRFVAVDISVILPVFNGAETIAAQLAAVTSQTTTFSWELVVVDNGSTDGTAAIVDESARSDTRVRRVEAPTLHNLSYVRNTGVRAATGTSVVFCDDDDVVAEGWLDALASALVSTPFVASRMEYRRLNSTDVMRGRAEFQSTELATLFGYVVSNGAIGVRRDVWEALGGNDEHLGVAGEDFDFAIRAQRDLDIRPVLVEQAEYHYRQRGGARATWTQARRYGRAHAALYRRYGSGRVNVRAETRRALNDWWWIVSRSPLLVQSSRRVRWARKAGMRSGRLIGSLHERVWYP
jgi:glycosyltransferase involved in cell wall biosynthesis